MSGANEYGAELTDFRRRVAELQTARALPAHQRLSALDAALIELQHVADVLWPRYEQLASAARAPGGGRADPREQQLLRALFQRLPIPVVLLDRDCVVRRMNFSATQLFQTRAGYATGRPLTESLRRDGRAVLRSQVAAVARDEGGRSLVVHLPGPGSDGALRVTLAGLRPPGEPHSAVLATFQPTGEGAVAVAAPTVPGQAGGVRPPGARRPDLDEVTRHAERLDLIDDMATTLLGTVALANSGPKTVLDRAAAVLHGRFADWVIADVAADPARPETARRVVALGPPDATADRVTSVAEQDPAGCPLVAEAIRDGVSALQVRPHDADAFGRDASGAPVLVREDVTSLLCVPLRVSPAEPVLGALTLFRTGGRGAFEMAEAGVADRLSRHIALALGRISHQPPPSEDGQQRPERAVAPGS
ncbi:PAS domain-containing protein [Streptomyces sparsogenes]|uniref:PAS fold-4 domain-containing protein n=1 Tax=Streptomyces sparsogenes DSM 40356 TaxID=1331668 RepID=A0A1R1SSF5_9ACTN|nr:PAS domain-containing protein [Streptomyces sparsogenes]OMI41193.1 PAS fold-4 domain-containing protein [Streptomyces sparsogenes DSM 40356]